MEEFINQLLKDSGVPDTTDPEVREQLVKDLQSRVADLINKRLVEAMSEDDLRDFEKILDERPDNAGLMQQFIDQHVPNKEQIAATTLLEFRALYLGKAV